jgi:hypothetical protein
VIVGLGYSPAGAARGLLGNGNARSDDDLLTRDGKVLAQPLSFADLYHAYGESLRVAPGDSLFGEEKGVELAAPARPFYAADLDDAHYQKAHAACIAAGIKVQALLDACTLDVAVIGSPEAAQSFVGAPAPAAVMQPGDHTYGRGRLPHAPVGGAARGTRPPTGFLPQGEAVDAHLALSICPLSGGEPARPTRERSVECETFHSWQHAGVWMGSAPRADSARPVITIRDALMDARSVGLDPARERRGGGGQWGSSDHSTQRLEFGEETPWTGAPLSSYAVWPTLASSPSERPFHEWLADSVAVLRMLSFQLTVLGRQEAGGSVFWPAEWIRIEPSSRSENSWHSSFS